MFNWLKKLFGIKPKEKEIIEEKKVETKVEVVKPKMADSIEDEVIVENILPTGEPTTPEPPPEPTTCEPTTPEPRCDTCDPECGEYECEVDIIIAKCICHGYDPDTGTDGCIKYDTTCGRTVTRGEECPTEP